MDWRTKMRALGYEYGDVVTVDLPEDTPELRAVVRAEQTFQARAVLAELGREPRDPEFVEPWIEDGKVWLAWGQKEA
jgi:triacylglycerol esterase/lipase EstA (alpha/beta hydrolase family)